VANLALVQKISAATQDYLLKAPLVSVVISNHNYGRYIEQAIRSVATQTYKDWECLIVDDASTDGSVRIIDACLATLDDERFSLVRLERNVGQLGALKVAIPKLSGVFVAFLDADDVWLPSFLAQHVQAHLNQTFSAGVTTSDTYFVDEWDQVLAGTAPNLENKPRGETIDGGLRRASGHGLAYDNGRVVVTPSDQPSLTHVSPTLSGWHATAMSSMMFRANLLPFVMPADSEAFRICADYPMYSIAHLISGTIIIDASLSLYRLHGRSGYSNLPWMGGQVSRLADHGAMIRRLAPHMLEHINTIRSDLERLCRPQHVKKMIERFDIGRDEQGRLKLLSKIRRETRRLLHQTAGYT
jgi:glycosyltransferase involved in cell wall biosynthesis